MGYPVEEQAVHRLCELRGARRRPTVPGGAPQHHHHRIRRLLITIPACIGARRADYRRTRSRLAGFFETAVFIPHVVSLVPAAMAWKWIFDARLGPLNAILASSASRLGLGSLIRSISCVYHRPLLLAGVGLAVMIFWWLQEPADLPLRGCQARWRLGLPALLVSFDSAPEADHFYVSVVTLVSGFNVYAQAFVLASDAQGAPGRQVRVWSSTCWRTAFAITASAMLPPRRLFCWRCSSLDPIQFGLLREKGAR